MRLKIRLMLSPYLLASGNSCNIHISWNTLLLHFLPLRSFPAFTHFTEREEIQINRKGGRIGGK